MRVVSRFWPSAPSPCPRRIFISDWAFVPRCERRQLGPSTNIIMELPTSNYCLLPPLSLALMAPELSKYRGFTMEKDDGSVR